MSRRELLEFKSPNAAIQNTISFTCRDSVINTMFTILYELKMLGELGCAREIIIEDRAYCFDGDGQDRIDYIKVNGLSLDEWRKELRRIGKLNDDE